MRIRKRAWVGAVAAGVLAGLPASPLHAGVIAHWNFNFSDGDLYNWDADYGAGYLSVDPTWTSVGLDEGTDVNTLFEAPAGDALALRGSANNGGYVELGVSTVGFADLVFSFATSRNDHGFNNNEVWYSVDGGAFTLFDSYVLGESYEAMVFDFTTVDAVENVESLVIRLRLDGACNNDGLNRLDNVHIEGAIIPAPGALALLALAGLGGTSRRRRGAI